MTNNFGGLKAVDVGGRESDADDGDEGDEAEEPPAECAADAEEGDWSVGAENEEENITMINDAEDFFASEATREGVIDTRDDIENNHGSAEN